MLAPENPIGIKGELATAHLSKLSNMIKMNTHSDNHKWGHSPNDAPPYKKIALSSEECAKLFEKKK